MLGRAGDVFLMDLHLLHTSPVNSTKNVRMLIHANSAGPLNPTP